MPTTIDSQKPNSNSGGILRTVPSASRIGTLKTAARVMKAIATPPRTTVVRSCSALAEMVTGARISSAKGLVSPPVTKIRSASCDWSNSSINSASRSVSRLFSGKTKIEIRLAMIEAPTAR